MLQSLGFLGPLKGLFEFFNSFFFPCERNDHFDGRESLLDKRRHLTALLLGVFRGFVLTKAQNGDWDANYGRVEHDPPRKIAHLVESDAKSGHTGHHRDNPVADSLPNSILKHRELFCNLGGQRLHVLSLKVFDLLLEKTVHEFVSQVKNQVLRG